MRFFKEEMFDDVLSPENDEQYRSIFISEAIKRGKSTSKDSMVYVRPDQDLMTGHRETTKSYLEDGGPYDKRDVYLAQRNVGKPPAVASRLYANLRDHKPNMALDLAEAYVHSIISEHAQELKKNSRILFVGFHPALVNSLGFTEDTWVDSVAAIRLQPDLDNATANQCTYAEISNVNKVYQLVIVNNTNGRLTQPQLHRLILISAGNFYTLEASDERPKSAFGSSVSAMIATEAGSTSFKCFNRADVMTVYHSAFDRVVVIPLKKVRGGTVTIRRTPTHTTMCVSLVKYHLFMCSLENVDIKKMYDRASWALCMAHEVATVRKPNIFSGQFDQRNATTVYKKISVPDHLMLGDTGLMIKETRDIYLDVTAYNGLESYLANKDVEHNLAAMGAYIRLHFSSLSINDRLSLLAHCIVIVSSHTDAELMSKARAKLDEVAAKEVSMHWVLKHPALIQWHSLIWSNESCWFAILLVFPLFWWPFLFAVLLQCAWLYDFKRAALAIFLTFLSAGDSCIILLLATFPAMYGVLCLIVQPHADTGLGLTVRPWVQSLTTSYYDVKQRMLARKMKLHDEAAKELMTTIIGDRRNLPLKDIFADDNSRIKGIALADFLEQKDEIRAEAMRDPGGVESFKMIYASDERGKSRIGDPREEQSRRQRQLFDTLEKYVRDGGHLEKEEPPAGGVM